MKEDITMADGNGWAVAGILTNLDGAVLTRSLGDGGLAGTVDIAEALHSAANDAHFGHREGELG